MTFEQKRWTIYQAILNHSCGDVVVKPVSFLNDGVPNFIRELKKFQEDSRKRILLVK